MNADHSKSYLHTLSNVQGSESHCNVSIKFQRDSVRIVTDNLAANEQKFSNNIS